MAGSEAGTDAPLGWLKEVFSTRPASQIETEFDRIDVIAPKAHKHPFSAGSWRDLPMRQIPGYPDKAPLAHGDDTLYRFPPLVFTGEGRRSSPR